MAISVFIADDHVVLRDGVRLLIETQADMQVVGTAANGREAVDMVAGCQPDVVLMDIAMPEMDGIEATRRIRETCPSVQVLVLSMYATYEYVLRAFRAGARGYLLKDSAGTEVADAIRTIYTGQTFVSHKLASAGMEETLHRKVGLDAMDLNNPLARLSPRGREILRLVVEGKSSREIGEILAMPVGIVDTYRSQLMKKLGVDDIPGLMKYVVHLDMPRAN
ncbi:MAG: response regulator transcription factor [Chloroflexi bacterium]|jgi:DNA-binding NarL/FixJ family response regulator|nr:response regulator transcription factor [Chloroflexota bacterium]